MKPEPWSAIVDAEYVERLIPAIQRAIADVSPELSTGERGVSAPDLANVLLMLLATILEPFPACSTLSGMRKLAEAAGREFHQLMRETRVLNEAAAAVGTTVN